MNCFGKSDRHPPRSSARVSVPSQRRSTPPSRRQRTLLQVLPYERHRSLLWRAYYDIAVGDVRAHGRCMAARGGLRQDRNARSIHANPDKSSITEIVYILLSVSTCSDYVELTRGHQLPPCGVVPLCAPTAGVVQRPQERRQCAARKRLRPQSRAAPPSAMSWAQSPWCCCARSSSSAHPAAAHATATRAEGHTHKV